MTYTGGKVNIRLSQFRITLHPDSVQNYIANMNDGGNTQNNKLGFKTLFYFGQVLVLHYENLKSDMKSEIRKVLSFLRLPIDESRYDKLLHFNEYLN